MTRYATLTALVAAAALGLSAAAGEGRRSALLGAGISSFSAFASLGAFATFGRRPGKPLQRTLAIFVVMFLVRLVLVAAGLVVVVRSGASAVPFVVAFFVPYFIFTAIEGAAVQALGRGMGKTA